MQGAKRGEWIDGVEKFELPDGFRLFQNGIWDEGWRVRDVILIEWGNRLVFGEAESSVFLVVVRPLVQT